MSDLIFDANFSAPRLSTALSVLKTPVSERTDEEVKSLSSIRLSSSEANSYRAGALMRIFFPKAALLDLLDQTNCVALRFYPAFDQDGEASLLAVGINASRQDLVMNIIPSRKANDKCFISEGEQRPVTNIPVKEGEKVLETINNMIGLARKAGMDREKIFPLANTSSRSAAFSKVTFTSETLFELLGNPKQEKDKEEVDGIYFYTAKIKFNDDTTNEYKTLGAVARSNGKEEDMILSALPCPPYCGGDGYVGGSGAFS